MKGSDIRTIEETVSFLTSAITQPNLYTVEQIHDLVNFYVEYGVLVEAELVDIQEPNASLIINPIIVDNTQAI